MSIKKRLKNNLHQSELSFFKNADSYKNIVQDIITLAKKKGATAAEVDASLGGGFSISVRKGELESADHSNGKTLGVTVYFGKKSGSAISSDLTPEAINLVLEKACHFARCTEKDPFIGLADKKLMAFDYPDLDLFYPWDIQVEKAIELALECEACGFAFDKRITNSEGASVVSSQVLSIYANSHGFMGTIPTSRHNISASFIASKGKEMQRDISYSKAIDPLNLEKPKIIAEDAAAKALKRLGAKRIKTCHCPVIFQAEVARSIISTLLAAVSGTAIYRKSSFLLNKLNKPVTVNSLTIREDPLIPRAFGSTPYDSEGVKLYPSNIVTDGVLNRYVLDSYSARKLKTKTTGNAGGLHNVLVSTGNQNLAELMREMNTGLLVVELLGNGVNLITGDYSRGAFGYWVENGEIKFPVIGATIAGNLKDMLKGIVKIGNDIDRRSSLLTGSILIDKMTVAGN